MKKEEPPRITRITRKEDRKKEKEGERRPRRALCSLVFCLLSCDSCDSWWLLFFFFGSLLMSPSFCLGLLLGMAGAEPNENVVLVEKGVARTAVVAPRR